MRFPDSDRPVDILDPDLAAVRKADVNAIADAFIHDRRNADRFAENFINLALYN
jgi:hypothetical protein